MRMRRFWVVLAGLSVAAVAGSQTADSVVAAKQAEAARMGKIFYRADFNAPGWTRVVLPGCPAFAHHAFAEFDAAAGGGRYLAVYRTDTPVVRSLDKPWTGGTQVVPLPEKTMDSDHEDVDEGELVTLFNRLLTAEGSRKAGREALAGCFMAITGEVATGTNVVPVTTPPVGTAFVDLAAPSGFVRTQYLRFGDDGAIVEARMQARRVRP